LTTKSKTIIHNIKNLNKIAFIKKAKFTYTGRETRIITRLFKNTNIKVTHTTNNNVRKLLDTQRSTKPRNKFEMNGVYQMISPTCFKKYIGQTDQHFHVLFNEHYREYKYANNMS
jgi:hypothetical protein